MDIPLLIAEQKLVDIPREQVLTLAVPVYSSTCIRQLQRDRSKVNSEGFSEEGEVNALQHTLATKKRLQRAPCEAKQATGTLASSVCIESLPVFAM